MTPSPHKLIVIAGPTASGKTALAIDVALKHQAEIISFDSRQFFKEISIGTAKPSEKELAEVPHHFIGNLSIHDEYNAGKYENQAIEKLGELFQKHSTVVMVGGSGMYLDAVLYGFDEMPVVDVKVREKIEEIYKEEGLEVIQLMLQKMDPEHYNNVDLNNPHRIIRALGVCITTGISYTEHRKGRQKPRNFTAEIYGIELERPVLYERINQRVLNMMDEGLEEEARSVYELRHLNSLQTVGYKELFSYFSGETDLQTAIHLIQQNTRRFAKRQVTWFKKYEAMQWLAPEEILNTC